MRCSTTTSNAISPLLSVDDVHPTEFLHPGQSKLRNEGAECPLADIRCPPLARRTLARGGIEACLCRRGEPGSAGAGMLRPQGGPRWRSPVLYRQDWPRVFSPRTSCPALLRLLCVLGIDTPPLKSGRFSVLRRSLRHGSPKALPEPFSVPGSVVVPMQARPAHRARVPAHG